MNVYECWLATLFIVISTVEISIIDKIRIPREFVEKVGTRAKNSNGGGGEGEEEGRDGKDHGLCGQAFPLLPSPSPFHFTFALAVPFCVLTRLETLATQTKALLACENRRLFQLLFRKLYIYI